MTIDIDAIRQREQAATPGPWRWYGNTDVQRIYLSTVRWGRQLVMSFERWGMQSAQPSFVDGRTWKPNPESDYDFAASGWVKPARDLARYEVAPNATSRKDPAVYRADISAVRNPDAEFIAHAREDVRVLLAKVDELTAERDVARDMANTARAETANALRALDQARAVVEAAKAWREWYTASPVRMQSPSDAEDALIAAVDALPKPTEAKADDKRCCGYCGTETPAGVKS